MSRLLTYVAYLPWANGVVNLVASASCVYTRSWRMALVWLCYAIAGFALANAK